MDLARPSLSGSAVRRASSAPPASRSWRCWCWPSASASTWPPSASSIWWCCGRYPCATPPRCCDSTGEVWRALPTCRLIRKWHSSERTPGPCRRCWPDYQLALEGEEKQIDASFVTANFFRELGATATSAGCSTPPREAPGAAPAVVLGYGFWQRHFGADPLVIGRTIRLNGKPATVLGVAPAIQRSQFERAGRVGADTQQPYFAPAADC